MKRGAIFFFIFLIPCMSFGCGCDTLSFNEASEWADEIFLGRIIRLREVNNYQLDGSSNTRIWSALFEVEKKWKGGRNRYVEVFQSGTSCDFNFEFPSQPYIVYAKNAELIWWDPLQSFTELGTWMCSRTADVSTYEKWVEWGFDDRENLDHKYPEAIKLIGINFQWKWLLIGLSLFGGGVVSGYILRKHKSD